VEVRASLPGPQQRGTGATRQVFKSGDLGHLRATAVASDNTRLTIR
jgi:hypothetical protein